MCLHKTRGINISLLRLNASSAILFIHIERNIFQRIDVTQNTFITTMGYLFLFRRCLWSSEHHGLHGNCCRRSQHGSRTRVEHLSTMLIISHACREIDEYTTGNNPTGWIINKVLHFAYWYTGTRSRLRIIHHRTIPRAHFRSGLIGAHADKLSIFRFVHNDVQVTSCNVTINCVETRGG